MSSKNPVHVDLTVVINFGEDYGEVMLVDDMRMPFTDFILEARNRSAELVFTGLIKAAAVTPGVVSAVMPITIPWARK